MPSDTRREVTVRDLAAHLGCPYEGDGDVLIKGVASLERARPGDIVYLSHPKFREKLARTEASAAILPPEEKCVGLPVIRSENPHLAFVIATGLFFSAYRPEPGVHPLAHISPSAKLGEGISVGPLAFVGDGAEIGPRTVVFPLAVIYPRAKIGEDCIIHSHVSIREEVRIGNRVIIHNGAVIGGDGFGYLSGPDGSRIKIPQLGLVVIEDEVEIGANTAIDRAALDETVIRRGTKIDNLVQVAHNVEVGANSILAAQTGIAGSTRIGSNVIFGGQVGVTDHAVVGNDVIASAKTGITKDVPANSFVAGFPHLDVRDWRKMWAVLPQVYGFMKEYRKLKARVEELEKKIGSI